MVQILINVLSVVFTTLNPIQVTKESSWIPVQSFNGIATQTQYIRFHIYDKAKAERMDVVIYSLHFAALPDFRFNLRS